MRKVSFAVLPSSSFSRDGSCRPGTCTRMRSVPWRWIDGSTVPSSLTRRSTIWIDCSTDWRMRSMMAGSVGGEPDQAAAGIDDVDRTLAGGAEDAAERLRQFAQLGQRRAADRRLRGCGTSTVVAADRRSGRCCRAALSRSTRRTSSRSVSSFSLRTALVSTSSRMCEPPCRSRPSTMWRCAQVGHDCTVCSGKKFGTAKTQTSKRREQDRRRLPAGEIKHRSGGPSGGLAIACAISSTRRPPSPARPWRARRSPSSASGAPARRRRSRPRPARRRPPW